MKYKIGQTVALDDGSIVKIKQVYRRSRDDGRYEFYYEVDQYKIVQENNIKGEQLEFLIEVQK